MKPSQALTLLFAGVASCAASLELMRGIPSGWELLQELPRPTQPLQFSFALVQPSMKDLDSKIGPGKDHLTLDQVRALRAPDPEHVALVTGWLKDNGIDNITSSNEWIHVNTDVSKAESLLNMKLHHFGYPGSEPRLRTQNYELPDSVKDVIKLVHPLQNFMRPRRKLTPSNAQARPAAMAAQSEDSTAAAAAVPCQGGVTPECLKQLYNITSDATNPSSSDVRIGVAGFLEQYTNYADVQTFLHQQAPQLVGRNFTVESVHDGADNQGLPGLEAALDIQYVMAIASPAKAIYYSTGGRGVKLGPDGRPINGALDDNEPYLDLLEYLLCKPDDQLPHVLSMSYGDDELSVPADFAQHVCDSFGLLTARGVTILGSSGDGGSAGGQRSNCMTNDGTNRQVTMGTFPATCQWITSVGATSNGQEPPVAANFSSGGFSQRYPRPSWQNGAGLVDDYIKQLNGHLAGHFDGSMRAFPDISLVGTSFAVVLSNQTVSVDGTSASTPLLASMLALVTDARLKRGKRPLGWLNQLLYSEGVRRVLQDVTLGTSQTCTWNGVSPGGWPATPGWDAVTGLGVAKDFDRFLQVLVGSP